MGAAHRLAVDGHHFALGELGHGLNPLNETMLELLRIQPGEDVFEGIMGGTETEMLKEPRIILGKVAHADQASGRVPAHVLQAKVKVREELVSAVREKYEAYLATAN